MSQTLDGYEIRSRIGSGGLADVYLAWEEDHQREVALKILRDPERDETHVRRFLREGRLLQSLAHPRLPRCLKVLTHPRPILVLERLQGMSLSQHLRTHGPMSPHRVEGLAAALLEVLAFLHSHGIIHRDVKSGNIYLEQDGRILLMDLGLAVDPTDLLTTTLGDIIGTYAYMAPEQIAGAEVDTRSDLYSLGITLYETLAGRRPYRADGAVSYLQAHLAAQFIPLREVAPQGTPRRLITLIERMMAADPLDRPYSARVAQALLAGQSLHDELRQPPFTGRSSVLGALEAILDGGGTVHLIGEPGTGLSRCAQVAYQQARARGAEVITLPCGRLKTEAALLQEISRSLKRLLGSVITRRERIADSLVQLSAEAPMLLITEDIDQLPAPTVRTLIDLIRLTRLPALTTSHRGPPESFPGHTLRLRPLHQEEMRELVCGMLAARSAPPGLVEALQRFTGGLPAFAVAVIRDLHQRGALRWQGLDADGRQIWQLTRTDWVTEAHPLRRIFREGLEGMRPEERSLLEILSVADDELPLSVALAAASLDEGSTAPFKLTSLQLAVERTLPGSTEPWIGLKRPITGAMVRLDLSEDRLQALHRSLTLALPATAPGPWLEERLPYHEALSLPPDRSAQALLGLGDWLAQRQKHRRAQEVLDRVSDKMGLTPLMAVHLALTRGTTLLALGRIPESREALLAARRLAAEMERQDLVAKATLSLGQGYLRLGNISKAVDRVEEVLNAASDSVHTPTLPAAMILRAQARSLQGQTDPAEEGFRNAMDISLLQGRMDLAGRAQLGLAQIARARGHFEEARHALESAGSLTLSAGDGEGAIRYFCEAASQHLQRGEVRQALGAAGRAEELSAMMELAWGRVLASLAWAEIHLRCGDLLRAENLLLNERFSGELEGDQLLKMAWLEQIAALRLAREDRPAALAIHQQARALAEDVGWFIYRAYHSGMVAILTARGEDLSTSLSQLYEADDRARAARLLLEGARMTADVEILAEARAELRLLGDQFLLIRALHMSGGEDARDEIRSMKGEILRGTPPELRSHLEGLAAFTWAR